MEHFEFWGKKKNEVPWKTISECGVGVVSGTDKSLKPFKLRFKVPTLPLVTIL